MQEHVKILSGQSIFVNRISAVLREAKIVSLIKDQVESGRLAGFGTPSNAVGLFVFKSDAEKAIEIIKKFKEDISSLTL